MEKEHKKLITKNLVDLIELIDVKLITPFLMEERIFTKHMLEDIFSEKTLTDVKQKMLLELCTRGPDAFHKFLKVLKDLGNHKALALLKPDYALDQRLNRNNAMIDQPLDRKNSMIDQLLDRKNTMMDQPQPGGTNAENLGANQLRVKFATELKVGPNIYKMNSKPRGYCLIINNEDFNGILKEREGTEIDALRLDMVFREIDYDVKLRKNVKADDMMDLLKSFACKKEHAFVDSCIVVILSHGEMGFVYGTDANKVYMNKIIELFDNSNCPSLINKPKLFFIQACRGKNIDIGVSVEESADAVPSDFGNSLVPLSISTSRIPTLTDMLISHSTVEGNISIRNHHLGSWYCQELVRALMTKACDSTLTEILQEVDINVRKRISCDGEKQSTSYTANGWQKKLYFNPGLY